MSTSTPHIKILDINKKPIVFGGKDIRDFIVSFTYDYKEAKEGDECEITLFIPRESFGLFDMSELQKNSALYISWGYLGNMGSLRKIAIFDREKKYKNSGSDLKLICLSWVYYLSKVKSDGDQGDDLYAKALNIVKQGYKVEFKFPDDWYRDIPGETLKISLDEEGLPEAYTFSNKAKAAASQQILTKVPFKLDIDTISGYFRKPGFFNYGYYKKAGEAVSVDNILSGLNHTVLEEWEGIIKEYDDSLIIDGRDDILTIKNRALNAPAIDTFIWGSDDRVLGFSTETNDNNTAGNDTTVVVVDNENNIRMIKAHAIQGETLEDLDFYFRQNPSSYGDPDELEYTIRDGKYYVRRVGQSDVELPISDPQRVEILTNILKEYYTKTGGIRLQRKVKPITKIVKTNQYNPKTIYPPTLDRQLALREIVELDYPINIFNDLLIEAMPDYHPDDIIAQLTRATADNELKRISGTLVIVGDPQWELDEVILIQGVAKEDMGKYYINGSVHKINSSGYTTELALWKAPRLIGTVKASYTKKLEGEWEKLEKFITVKFDEFLEDMNMVIDRDKRAFFIEVEKAETDSNITPDDE